MPDLFRILIVILLSNFNPTLYFLKDVICIECLYAKII